MSFNAVAYQQVGAPPALPSVLPLAYLADGSPQTWTNMPAAATPFRGFTHNVLRVDLTEIDDVRLVTYMDVTAGIVGSFLFVQYTLDLTGAAGWTTIATNCDISAVGGRASAWVAVPAAARAEVLVRLMGQGGDAVRDPIFGNTILYGRST